MADLIPDLTLDFAMEGDGLRPFKAVEDSPATKNSGEPKPWVVVYQPGQDVRMDTGILLGHADVTEQKAAIGKQLAGGVGMFLSVEDFNLEFNRMSEAGVEFIKQPRESSYGKTALFLDICGNKWDRIQPAK